ncbi:hypothetical protein T484DRAFT_1910076 [Baffinella frigidus]|nr:hypothetical protein T484DRAFT_1910076 [Cryptophyta sp. CCMP2293]
MSPSTTSTDGAHQDGVVGERSLGGGALGGAEAASARRVVATTSPRPVLSVDEPEGGASISGYREVVFATGEGGAVVVGGEAGCGMGETASTVAGEEGGGGSDEDQGGVDGAKGGRSVGAPAAPPPSSIQMPSSSVLPPTSIQMGTHGHAGREGSAGARQGGQGGGRSAVGQGEVSSEERIKRLEEELSARASAMAALQSQLVATQIWNATATYQLPHQ